MLFVSLPSFIHVLPTFPIGAPSPLFNFPGHSTQVRLFPSLSSLPINDLFRFLLCVLLHVAQSRMQIRRWGVRMGQNTWHLFFNSALCHSKQALFLGWHCYLWTSWFHFSIWLSNIMYMNNIFIIPIEGRLVYFHFLTIANRAGTTIPGCFLLVGIRKVTTARWTVYYSECLSGPNLALEVVPGEPLVPSTRWNLERVGPDTKQCKQQQQDKLTQWPEKQSSKRKMRCSSAMLFYL